MWRFHWHRHWHVVYILRTCESTFSSEINLLMATLSFAPIFFFFAAPPTLLGFNQDFLSTSHGIRDKANSVALVYSTSVLSKLFEAPHRFGVDFESFGKPGLGTAEMHQLCGAARTSCSLPILNFPPRSEQDLRGLFDLLLAFEPWEWIISLSRKMPWSVGFHYTHFSLSLWQLVASDPF